MFAVEIDVPRAACRRRQPASGGAPLVLGLCAACAPLVRRWCAAAGPSPRVSSALMPSVALAGVPAAAAAASVAELLEVEWLDALARLNRELRVPLNAMLGLAQLIETAAKTSPDDSTLGHSSAILSSGRQMLDMIDELLVLRDAGLAALRTTLMPLDIEGTLHR